MSAAGFGVAWLGCAIGNERMARFYGKRGWRRVRTERYHAETPAGSFPLDVWRHEKALSGPT